MAAIAGYLIYKSSIQINLSNGDKMDDIVMAGPEGEFYSLYAIENKYILVQFWASWCGPCVKEIPELKEIYTEYKNQKIGSSDGFEIYAVSLNFDEQRWKNSLTGLGINWSYNVNDTLAFKSAIARKYNIGSIPTNVLLNPQYEIVGVDLSPEQVRKLLDRFKRQ
jgi:thiol-disulfide isomerase/thioredoxin